MELWIRSQDRESLVKVDNLYISVGNYICYYVEKGKEVPNTYFRPSGELGRYATKERALEVLNEIQELLMPKIVFKDEGRDYITPQGQIYKLNIKQPINTDMQELSSYVYEMPKD